METIPSMEEKEKIPSTGEAVRIPYIRTMTIKKTYYMAETALTPTTQEIKIS